MGDFDIQFQQDLARESWSLYGVGIFLIGLRIFARVFMLGLKRLQIDDYIMIAVGCLYSVLVVCLNVIAQGGGSNLYPPDDFVTFTPDQIQDRIHGSKIVIVSEQAMLNVIYLIKTCMLIMYSRLTLGLKEQLGVKIIAIYVACGWVGTELAFFFACRPFQGYWAMPPPNPQCTTLQYYAIAQGTFNISSDCLMLLITLPLLIRMNVPWKQKIVLVLIFSLGIFVILAAILTKVFNLSNVWDPSYMLWYTREASVAIYVSNLPMIWPLLRHYIPFLRTTTPRNRGASSTALKSYGNGTTPVTTNNRSLTGGPRSAKPSLAKRLSDGITTTIGNGRIGSGGAHARMDELDSGDELDFVRTRGSTEKMVPESRSDVLGAPGGLTGITKSTTVHIREERTGDSGFDFGMAKGQDVEKGQRKWDWESDGGNVYCASATTAGRNVPAVASGSSSGLVPNTDVRGSEREREGRPSTGSRTDAREMMPRRVRSSSRAERGSISSRVGVQGSRDRGPGTKVVSPKMDTEDEQLKRF